MVSESITGLGGDAVMDVPGVQINGVSLPLSFSHSGRGTSG